MMADVSDPGDRQNAVDLRTSGEQRDETSRAPGVTKTTNPAAIPGNLSSGQPTGFAGELALIVSMAPEIRRSSLCCFQETEDLQFEHPDDHQPFSIWNCQ
jgi:hypothetical protein